MHQSMSDYSNHRASTSSNVRAEVARSGLSQSDIAGILRISQAAVSRRLSGKVEFSASQLSTLATELNVPVATFFTTKALAGDAEAS